MFYFHLHGILYILSHEIVTLSSFLLFQLSFSFPCKVTKEMMMMVTEEGRGQWEQLGIILHY